MTTYTCTQCGTVCETPEPCCDCNAPITVDMSADMAGTGGM